MTRQATRLRTQRPLPGTHLSLACAVGAAAAVTPYLSAYSRWRSSEALCNLPHRLTGGNATRDLFALVEPQCYQSSPAWRRRNSSIESQDPIDTALVPPLKRSSDVRHTLTALPAFPKFSLLLRREPCPCMPFHAHTSSSRKIRSAPHIGARSAPTVGARSAPHRGAPLANTPLQTHNFGGH